MSKGLRKDLLQEDGKWSIGRIMISIVFVCMISLWMLSSFQKVTCPEFVANNIHIVFMTMLGYIIAGKYKNHLSDKLHSDDDH